MNNENLKYDFTPTEARENGRKGGEASGETRKFKALLNKILNGKAIGKPAELLKQMGIPESERTIKNALTCSMIAKAMKGDVRATELVIKMIGEYPSDKMEITNLLSYSGIDINVKQKE